MNRLLAFSILFLSFLFADAQRLKEENVPAIVKASFQKLYPDIKKPRWEMENGNYEAEFRLKGIQQSALFDSSGTFVQMEVSISESELPQPIKDYLKKNFPGQKLKEISRITKASGDVLYEIGIKEKEVLLDSEGQVIEQRS